MEGKGLLNRFNLLAIVYISAFMGPFGGSMVVAMFPELKGVFNVDIAVMALTVTVFMVPYSVSQIFFGPLSDIYGRKLLMAAGLAIYAAGAFLAASCDIIAVFMASRVIQGVGGAMALPVAMAMLGDEFPPQQLGKAMGGLSVAITLGLALGPLTGGIMTGIDWRLAFIVTGLLPLAVILLLHTWKAKPPTAKPKEPIKILEVLTMPAVLATGLVGFIVFLVRIGTYTFTADALGEFPYLMSGEQIGYLLSLAGFTGLVAGPLAGVFSDRFGRFPAALLGMAFLFAAFLLLAMSEWSVLMPIIMVLLGGGSTTVFTTLGAVSVEAAPWARGTATSLYGFLRFMGYALGPVVLLPAYQQLNVLGVALASETAVIAAFPLLYTIRKTLASQKNLNGEYA